MLGATELSEIVTFPSSPQSHQSYVVSFATLSYPLGGISLDTIVDALIIEMRIVEMTTKSKVLDDDDRM